MFKHKPRILDIDPATETNADHVVERHPGRPVHILPLIIVALVFVIVSLVNDEGIDVKNAIEAVSRTSDIHQLVAENRVEAIREQLPGMDGAAINEVVSGMTPIMLAASSGNVEIIDLLYNHGADPNKRGSAQRTALQYATEKNHVDAAKRLLAYGADIDGYDNGRLTPLIMAANRGYTELALFYVDNGADVNIQHSDGWTALIDAVVRNDGKLVRALIFAGADTQVATSNGMKAIDYARQYGHKELVRLLGKQQ